MRPPTIMAQTASASIEGSSGEEVFDVDGFMVRSITQHPQADPCRLFWWCRRFWRAPISPTSSAPNNRVPGHCTLTCMRARAIATKLHRHQQAAGRVVAKVPDEQVLGDLDGAVKWAGEHGGDVRR